MGAPNAICSCASSAHELPGCRHAHVCATRGTLFEDLYSSASVRLLNPGYLGDDSTSRRFALIEIE